MPARDDILTKIRRNLPQATELPDLAQGWTTYPDPAVRFAEVLATVGGRCVRVASLAEVDRQLTSLPPYQAAKQRVTFVPGAGETNVDLAAMSDPHALRDVDFALLPGQVAVAENGAVWIATDDVLQRTLYFLAQHIALVVPAANVVSNLHEAYARIDATAYRFGTFLSGPSKTADIEQSLVIGAHGARSLTVFLV
jgi:L-lactate dehydrogenase complex protein LldG